MGNNLRTLEISVKPLILATGEQKGWAFVVTYHGGIVAMGGGGGITKEQAMGHAEEYASEFSRQLAALNKGKRLNLAIASKNLRMPGGGL